MSTPATIGKLNEDGTVTCVHAQNSGYPEYTGKMLKANYVTEQKVDKLISLGDFSTLEALVIPTTETHTYETPEPGVTRFYTRDRGEDWEDCQPIVRANIETFYHRSDGYAYIFAYGRWFLLNQDGGKDIGMDFL